MLKPTKHNLQKLEDLLVELGYAVRYEKGSFQSGYCLVENRKIAVINKFFDLEGRVNTLIDILITLEVLVEALSETGKKTYRQAMAVEKEQEEGDGT